MLGILLPLTCTVTSVYFCPRIITQFHSVLYSECANLDCVPFSRRVHEPPCAGAGGLFESESCML